MRSNGAQTVICPTCGSESDPAWSFCGSCGGPQHAQEMPGEEATAPAGFRAGPDAGPMSGDQPTSPMDGSVVTLPTWESGGAFRPPAQAQVPSRDAGTRGSFGGFLARRWPMIAVAALALAAVVVATLVHLGTRDELSETKNVLSTTRSTLTDTRQTLDRTEASLESTKDELDSTEGQLAARTRERNDLQAQLQGLQGSLSAAEGRIDLQAGQIESLKSCLTGVSTALGYAAVEDYISAVASLEAVTVSCEAAYALF